MILVRINTDPCKDDVSGVSSFYFKCLIYVLIDLDYEQMANAVLLFANFVLVVQK